MQLSLVEIRENSIKYLASKKKDFDPKNPEDKLNLDYEVVRRLMISQKIQELKVKKPYLDLSKLDESIFPVLDP